MRVNKAQDAIANYLIDIASSSGRKSRENAKFKKSILKQSEITTVKYLHCVDVNSRLFCKKNEVYYSKITSV